jgi:hypothetical protein
MTEEQKQTQPTIIKTDNSTLLIGVGLLLAVMIGFGALGLGLVVMLMPHEQPAAKVDEIKWYRRNAQEVIADHNDKRFTIRLDQNRWIVVEQTYRVDIGGSRGSSNPLGSQDDSGGGLGSQKSD